MESTEAVIRRSSVKKMFLNFRKIHRKIPVSESKKETEEPEEPEA